MRSFQIISKSVSVSMFCSPTPTHLCQSPPQGCEKKLSVVFFTFPDPAKTSFFSFLFYDFAEKSFLTPFFCKDIAFCSFSFNVFAEKNLGTPFLRRGAPKNLFGTFF